MHHVFIWQFLENLVQSVSSSASAQHRLVAVAGLGQPLVHTTAEACRALFVGSVQLVYNAAPALLSESCSNLCLCFQTRASAARQQVQSVSFHVNSDRVTVQSSRCKSSVEKKRKQLCVHVLNNRENPALRNNRKNITTAQRQHAIRINKICSSDTGLCSRGFYRILDSTT